MTIKMRFAVLLGVVALGACDGSGPNEEATDPESIALLQNYPYIYGGPTWQALGGSAVSAAIFNGQAYLGFVRLDHKIQIFQESNLGNNTGQSVNPNITLTDTSNAAPSLVAFNGCLYVLYAGQDGHLYMKQSSDGVHWGSTVQFDNLNLTGTGDYFRFRPAAVVFENRLFVFVVFHPNGGPDFLVQYNIGSDGSSTGPWSTTYAWQSLFSNVATETTHFAPGAAVWNGILYLSFAGTDSSRPLIIKHFDPNIGQWSGDTSVTGQNGVPSLFALPTEMEMVYYGNDNHIWRTYTTDGTTFTGTARDNGSSPVGPPAPFLAYGASDVWVFYNGPNGQLYTSIE